MKIALVGKYVALEDAYVSVVKALKHSALAVNRKLVLNFIDSENLQPRMQEWILLPVEKLEAIFRFVKIMYKLYSIIP